MITSPINYNQARSYITRVADKIETSTYPPIGIDDIRKQHGIEVDLRVFLESLIVDTMGTPSVNDVYTHTNNYTVVIDERAQGLGIWSVSMNATLSHCRSKQTIEKLAVWVNLQTGADGKSPHCMPHIAGSLAQLNSVMTGTVQYIEWSDLKMDYFDQSLYSSFVSVVSDMWETVVRSTQKIYLLRALSALRHVVYNPPPMMPSAPTIKFPIGTPPEDIQLLVLHSYITPSTTSYGYHMNMYRIADVKRMVTYS